MSKKYNSEASNTLFEKVAEQSKLKAKAIVIRFIPDEKLVDYPGNDEDISDTADLEESMKEGGFNDPLEVTPFGQPDGFYMILSGHRRRMAGRKVGYTEFPCIIKEHLKSDLDVENYVLSANRHRDSGKDPLLLVRRAAKEARYLKKTGTVKLQEEVAKRMGISQPMASRYLAVSRVIPQVQDMVRFEFVSLNSITALASRSVEMQEIIYNVMREAQAADVDLSGKVVKRIIEGCEAGKRTWVAISANPEPTKDSGLPLSGFINPESGETKEDAAGSRNDEVNRENDLIAAEYDAIEADREKYEESQTEQTETAGDTECEDETPANDPKPPKPPLSEFEQELENGKNIMGALHKLDTALEKFYRFPSSEDAEKAIDLLSKEAGVILEEIRKIANNYQLSETGKQVLEKLGDDCVANMDWIK